MAKTNKILKEMGHKMEELGHDMSKSIHPFSNSVEHAGEKVVKDVKKASKKMFK